MLGHERVHVIGIRNVGFEKFIVFAMFLDHAVQISQVTCIREHIDIGHKCGFVMLQNVANKIAPNESAAAGNENSHSDS